MTSILTLDNPFTGEVACELPILDLDEARAAVDRAQAAQRAWRRTPIAERASLVRAFAKSARAWKEDIAADITRMMGKPLTQALGEVDGMCDRALRLAEIAEDTLAEERLPERDGFSLFMRREPIGVLLTVAPWNYPLLTAINSVVAGVLAGNAVVLKHAGRTPLCGMHIARAFEDAGAPPALVQSIVVGHHTTAELIQHPAIGHVSFTGSVRGGHEVYASVARRFIGTTLELGGKDPAYVAEDANLDHAIENLTDGAFYNAGQSCCGIERIYVHQRHYERFVEGIVALAKGYVLGDPMAPATTLGPMATPDAPTFLADQVQEAVSKGARLLTGGSPTNVRGQGRFFEPTVLADATHQMSAMVDESFGPIIGIAPVANDDEAVALMNDSPFGLTAAIWTESSERAVRLGERLETGTVFMNRCDYLDPDLAWTGVKDTGLGVSLSRHGILAMTRLKSYHLRTRT